MPALCETGVPRAGRGFALLFTCVPGWIRALRSVARSCRGLVTFRSIAAFRNECFALRPVEFDVASDLACLVVAENLANRGERE
eukprot:4530650-Pleurochrysis_carterae.AAC.1